MYASRWGFVNPSNTGSGFEFQVIAAVVIGGVSINGGVGSVLGTVLGVLLLGCVVGGAAAARHSRHCAERDLRRRHHRRAGHRPHGARSAASALPAARGRGHEHDRDRRRSPSRRSMPRRPRPRWQVILDPPGDDDVRAARPRPIVAERVLSPLLPRHATTSSRASRYYAELALVALVLTHGDHRRRDRPVAGLQHGAVGLRLRLALAGRRADAARDRSSASRSGLVLGAVQRLPRHRPAAALDHRHHRHADLLSRPGAGARRRQVDPSCPNGSSAST